jgi:hypothetical protein
LTVPLTGPLLDVLRAIELKRLLLITESRLGLVVSWDQALGQYIDSLPATHFEAFGLKRSPACYEMLKTLKVPKLWLATEEDELGQFSINFIGSER